MDEIEFAKTYNAAVTAANQADGAERAALMIILQMIADLNARLLEFQVEEDC